MNPDGLHTTLRVLTQIENMSAIDVLTWALTAPESAIQEGVLHSLLSRRDETGHREVLRYWPTLEENTKSIAGEYPGRLLKPILGWIASGNEQRMSIACDAALSAAEYDVLPTLATIASDRENPARDLAARTLVALAETLFERANGPRTTCDRRDLQLIRGRLNTALETTLLQSPRPPLKELVEAYLLLCDRETPGLKRVLQDNAEALHGPIADALLSSRRPGVVKLLIDLLDDPHPPLEVSRIVSQRGDLDFLTALFTRLAGVLSPLQKRNLSQIRELSWLGEDLTWLESLDESAQLGAIRTLSAAGVPRGDAFRAVAHLARFGSVGGRLAAVGALGEFPRLEASRLIVMALYDNEPQVQAAALVQLREKRVPNALPRLIDLLESPHAVVCQKARECLPEFTFPRYLAAFDLLDEEVARRTGQIVRQVDGDTLNRMAKELTAEHRERRRLAPAVAQALNLAAEMEGHLVSLLRDEDHGVRSEAAAALRQASSADALLGLRRALRDPHLQVRLAAERSLQSIQAYRDAATGGAARGATRPCRPAPCTNHRT